MPTDRRAAEQVQADSLVLNPDELGPDPVVGMDLAVDLGIRYLEIRTADGANAVTLPTERLRRIRVLAEERQLTVLSLASPLWKWCRPEARPSGVDSFGFPTRVPIEDRLMWVERALDAAESLGAGIVRIFSHLLVEPELTEQFLSDPLIPEALAMASRRGVRLLLENEPVCTVASSQRLLGAMQRFHTMGLGLWLDLANLEQVGDASPESVRALAPYVGYVHVKDYRDGPDRARAYCPAGEGVVPYGEVLPVLRSVRPALPYALETHVRDTPADALASGAAFLRAHLSGGAA